MTEDRKTTTGGIHVFRKSVGLDAPINDVDLNEIRGRAMVTIVCADCGHAPIGKVLVNGWRTWLNHYKKPQVDYASRRSDGSARIPAPRIVITDLLPGPGYPSRRVWCEEHGEKVVSTNDIFSAIGRAKGEGKLVRLAL